MTAGAHGGHETGGGVHGEAFAEQVRVQRVGGPVVRCPVLMFRVDHLVQGLQEVAPD